MTISASGVAGYTPTPPNRKIVHLNTVAVGGAIPNLIQLLQQSATNFGFSAEVIYGRGPSPDGARARRVGRLYSKALDLLLSRTFDGAGRYSRKAAELVMRRFNDQPPDVVHIHNLHGYWMNLDYLLRGLSERAIPVIWTLHDYWPITGHCAYFESVNCEKWRVECGQCPQIGQYPRAYLDRSRRNFGDKKALYRDLRGVHVVSVSKHARNLLAGSILSHFPITTIYNAVDTSVFRPTNTARRNSGRIVVGCVARHWDERKGLADVVELRRRLDGKYEILVVGLTNKQIRDLPPGIVGKSAIMSTREMAVTYSSMDVLFNPSREETFGMTTLEAMACGIPVVLYDVSANQELQPDITSKALVRRGDVDAVASAIQELTHHWDIEDRVVLRRHVKTNFSKEAFIRRYFELYLQLLED